MALPSKNELAIQGATNIVASGGLTAQAISPQQQVNVQSEEFQPLVVNTNTSMLAPNTGDITQTNKETPEITSMSRSDTERTAPVHDDQAIMKRTGAAEEKVDQSSISGGNIQDSARSRGSQKIDKKSKRKYNDGGLIPFGPLPHDQNLKERAVKDWEQRGGWAFLYFFLMLVGFSGWIVFPARFQKSWRHIHIKKCIDDKCYHAIVDWFVIIWSILWGISFIHVFVLWWADYGVKIETYNPTIPIEDAGDDD